MKSIRKSAKGFTFVELIVVMAIIAVLTATLVMAVGAFLRDKKYDDANAKAETIYRALQIKLNQYDAECHMTDIDNGAQTTVEGIGGVNRGGISSSGGPYIYIGYFGNTTKIKDGLDYDSDGDTNEIINIGACSKVYDGSGSPVLTTYAYDTRGYIPDFDMGDIVRTLYIKRNEEAVDWVPSWMAKVNMETYTVEYVLYSEDNVTVFDDSTKGFLDRTSSDDDGYYTDVYDQQSISERNRLDQYVVGCYPMQSFYE